MVVSPYVRRRRLAAELLRLREEHGYSTQQLATATGLPRQRISQLQNGHVRPSDDEMIRILDALNVGQRRWEQIMAIARDARERGWWEKFRDEMGPRQALYADLEAGARSITEYQLTLLPGLLQIPRSPRFEPMPTAAPVPRRSTPSVLWKPVLCVNVSCTAPTGPTMKSSSTNWPYGGPPLHRRSCEPSCPISSMPVGAARRSLS
ncbi:hypothetical protein GCM10010112_82120 [Actinoplanes lobatus]|uniref:HTH cro/C1-type domain-containing protein n=1 Tax=Actinoplanes lobatus TaxID=113568 RepID=A0ABQ4AUT2_9ACTN|nr:hypothetical protein GCM10010112_82120 [Actinoplanes lobatus]GIE44709.1 hypothetical protein Alo02nite_76070 [Actinoplanes lobatus]